MSALETYTKQVRQMKGTEHMHALDSLRRYMNLTPEEELIQQINMWTDQDMLRTLIEAGVRGDVWRALVRRTEVLRKERAGGE